MDNIIEPQQQSRSVPVRILSTVAATATATVAVLSALVAAGVNLPAWVPIVVGGLGVIIPIALGEWTKNRVTPWEDVAAKRTPDGTVIAGPAAVTQTGQPVEVIPSS